jgi:hypothetical protein
LDEFGVIREIEKSDERIKAICDLHIEAIREKQSSLIVAPTHGEARRIAARLLLRNSTAMTVDESRMRANPHVRFEQREDAVNYLPGHVVEFHRRTSGGFKSGESG